MANTASRLSANGSLTISGSFDEVSGTYVTSGLVGSWDVNKSYYLETDASTWYDMAGNNNIKIYNNNGTPALFSPSSNSANITFFTTNGSSVSLGSYGVVAIPQLATTANVTIEGVINIRQLSGMLAGFHRYDIWTLGGGLGFNTFNSDLYGISAATVTSLNLLNRNVHYVFVMPRSNLPGAYQIWINGVQQSLSPLSGTSSPSRTYNLYDNTYTFQLNGHYAGTPVNGTTPSIGSYYGNASWSNFRMYNRILTSDEIRQNFNIASARYQLGSIIRPVVTATISNNTTQTITQTISGEFDEVTYNPSSNVPVNLISHSQDFTQVSQWSTISGLSVTSPGEIAPDGTRTAQLLTGNGVTTGYLNASFSWVIGNNYTFSCYFKSGTRSDFTILLYGIYFGTTGTGVTGCDFNLSNGVMNTFGGAIATMQNVGGGWFRCSVTTPAYRTRPIGDIGCQVIRLPTTSATLYAWGYQIEQSNSPSIYVRTGANAIIANTFNQRTVNTGNTYVRGTYDEYSKMSPITEGLIFNIDPGYDVSYIGSGATMYDTTQNRYRVDLNSSPPYSSDFGGVLKFTSTFGNNAWGNTSIPSGIITTTSNYTMSAWVKCNPTMKGLAETSFYNLATSAIVSPQANTGYSYGSTGSILGNNFFGGYGLYWATRINNNGIKELTFGFQNRINTPSLQQSSPFFSVNLNDVAVYLNWTHIAGVFNSSGNFCGFYVNGVLVNSTTTSQLSIGSFNFTTSTLRMCWDGITGGSPTGRNFDGDIGPMCIWNRALANTEIQQIFNSQRSRFGV